MSYGAELLRFYEAFLPQEGWEALSMNKEKGYLSCSHWGLFEMPPRLLMFRADKYELTDDLSIRPNGVVRGRVIPVILDNDDSILTS